MKLIVVKNNFKEGLDIVGKACGDNTELPILKNFKLEVDNDESKIKLSSTNLEIGINYFLRGKAIEKGAITIPFNIIYSIITNLQSDRINLETKNKNEFIIKTDNYEASIYGLPSDEFPIIPKIQTDNLFLKLKSDLFKDSLEKVISASRVSTTRPELNAVFLKLAEDKIELAATDSFRLAEKTILRNQFMTDFTKEIVVLIPLKTITELTKILKPNHELMIYYDTQQILFHTEEFELISRVIEGSFPDYKKVIPTKFETSAVLSGEKFIEAVKLISSLNIKNNEIRVKIIPSKKILEFSSTDKNIGKNKYILSAKIEGKSIEIIFNWRDLLDGLKNFKSGEVYLGANTEETPVMLKLINDKTYYYIIMPIIPNIS